MKEGKQSNPFLKNSLKGRQILLWVLTLMPLASVAFAARAAMTMDLMPPEAISDVDGYLSSSDSESSG